MMLVDVQVSLPFIIFALAVLAFVGNSLVILVIVVGIDGWERYARLSRSMVLSANAQDYVLAVRSLGLSNFKIYKRHVLPNITGTLVVQATINLPGVILLESTTWASHGPVVNSNFAARIAYSLYDQLVRRDYLSGTGGDGIKLVPGLATSWKQVAPTEWDFTIRQGVKFHDGSLPSP